MHVLSFSLCLICQNIFINAQQFHHVYHWKELRHVFGLKNLADKLPENAVTYMHQHDKDTVAFRLNDEQYTFHLTRKHRLVSPDAQLSERRDNQSFSLMPRSFADRCAFHGQDITGNGSVLSLTGCGDRQRGLVINSDGSAILIHPVITREKDATAPGHPHIIYKRSSTTFHPQGAQFTETNDEKTCLYDDEVGKFLQSQQRDEGFSFFSSSLAALEKSNSPYTIELGVFADDLMWDHFHELYGKDADDEMLEFILASVNNIDLLYSHTTLDPTINMVITRYEVLRITPKQMGKQGHLNGDVDRLLTGFCEYQAYMNVESNGENGHWDHGLLFSGHDFYRNNVYSVAGYAPVNGMCRSDRSCTINEGTDFGAVFVITHEMGHSLGMVHDGNNGCNEDCCIMSKSVGKAKTKWSDCSSDEVKKFVRSMSLQGKNCLLNQPGKKAGLFGSSTPLFDHGGILPGQRYSLDQQCRIYHGECFQYERREGSEMKDVCEILWCGSGDGFIRTSHPALEGSFCGNRKWCIGGKCVTWSPSSKNAPKAVDGKWSAWNDNPQTCESECKSCEVGKQLRVRRSIRVCENPAPNFGGRYCSGSHFRGIICSNNICSNSYPSPDAFATAHCRKLKSKNDDMNDLLTGGGFQYVESPCKMWCEMRKKNLIRAVGNYPDGTPCGRDQYCIKGECLRLACDKKAIVSNSARDCPGSTYNGDSGSYESDLGDWSQWSRCTKSCGRGVSLRFRPCLKPGGNCPGHNRKARMCNDFACPDKKPAWGSWSRWSDCSEPCGGGTRYRTRKCRHRTCIGSRKISEECNTQRCSSTVGWASWGPWNPCSRTCGGGVRMRVRRCQTFSCPGTR